MDGIDWSGAGDEGAAASQAAGAVPMDLDLDSALTPLEAQEDEAEDASATGAPPVLDDEDSDDDGWPRAFLEGFEASDNEDSGVEKDAGGGGSSASADTTPSHFAGVDGRAEVEGYRGTRDEGWSSPQAEVTNKDWTLAAFRQLFLEAHLTETAYNSLCNIVLNPKFTPSALALCTTAKTLRTKFAPIPTRTIYSHLVPTSVTSKSSGVVAQGSSRAYWYSVQDTIEHHLLQSRTLPILPPSPTPQDEPGLHQGLARSPAIKEEFYEGTLWQESIIAARPEYPLFAGKGGGECFARLTRTTKLTLEILSSSLAGTRSQLHPGEDRPPSSGPQCHRSRHWHLSRRGRRSRRRRSARRPPRRSRPYHHPALPLTSQRNPSLSRQLRHVKQAQENPPSPRSRR